MNLRTQFCLTKHSCLLVPASQNIVLSVSEMSFLVASLVLTPHCAGRVGVQAAASKVRIPRAGSLAFG